MGMDIARIRALCFDVDGTLRDTDDQIVNRLAGVLHPLEWIYPRGDYHRLARRVVMGLDDPANLALHLSDRLGLDNLAARMLHRKPYTSFQAVRTSPTMVAGVGEMLARLSLHYPLAVVSARDERGTMAFLDGNDLTPFFKVIVTGQTCRLTKPFPDPVQYAARAMGTSPESCLMIGDTIVDILCGRAAGAQTIGVLCGFGSEQELRRRGADWILPTTADLADYLLTVPGTRNELS